MPRPEGALYDAAPQPLWARTARRRCVWKRKEALLAMRSSAAVTCRAFVMLACLISIPLAAVFGASLPNIVVQWIDGQLPTPGEATRETLSEAPLYCPPKEWSSSPSAVASSAMEAGSCDGARDEYPPIGGQICTHNGGDLQRPAVLDCLDRTVSSVGPGVSATPDGAELVPVARATWPVPTGSHIPARRPAGVDFAGRGAVPELPPGLRDRVESRLRELGAVSYRLESWGPDAAFYHFCCRMPVGGSSTCTRHFEHVSARPADAMTAVVRQVEAWKAADNPTGRGLVITGP